MIIQNLFAAYAHAHRDQAAQRDLKPGVNFSSMWSNTIQTPLAGKFTFIILATLVLRL